MFSERVRDRLRHHTGPSPLLPPRREHNMGWEWPLPLRCGARVLPEVMWEWPLSLRCGPESEVGVTAPYPPRSHTVAGPTSVTLRLVLSSGATEAWPESKVTFPVCVRTWATILLLGPYLVKVPQMIKKRIGICPQAFVRYVKPIINHTSPKNTNEHTNKIQTNA